MTSRRVGLRGCWMVERWVKAGDEDGQSPLRNVRGLFTRNMTPHRTVGRC